MMNGMMNGMGMQPRECAGYSKTALCQGRDQQGRIWKN